MVTTLRSTRAAYHGPKPSNLLQDCTICAPCPYIASAPIVQRQRASRVILRELRRGHGPSISAFLRAVRTTSPSASDASHPEAEDSQFASQGAESPDGRDRVVLGFGWPRNRFHPAQN